MPAACKAEVKLSAWGDRKSGRLCWLYSTYSKVYSDKFAGKTKQWIVQFSIIIYVIVSVASLPLTMFVHISTFGIFNYVVVLVNKFFEFWDLFCFCAKSILLCDCVSQEPIGILKKPHTLLAYCLLSDNVQFVWRSAVRQRLVMQLSKHGQFSV